MILYRLRIYDTTEDDKYASSDRYNVIGGKASIWFLWYVLTRELGKGHVEVYTLDGVKCSPEKGITQGMSEYTELLME